MARGGARERDRGQERGNEGVPSPAPPGLRRRGGGRRRRRSWRGQHPPLGVLLLPRREGPTWPLQVRRGGPAGVPRRCWRRGRPPRRRPLAGEEGRGSLPLPLSRRERGPPPGPLAAAPPLRAAPPGEATPRLGVVGSGGRRPPPAAGICRGRESDERRERGKREFGFGGFWVQLNDKRERERFSY
jgi:hypothetical protein